MPVSRRHSRLRCVWRKYGSTYVRPFACDVADDVMIASSEKSEVVGTFSYSAASAGDSLRGRRRVLADLLLEGLRVVWPCCGISICMP